MSSATDLLTPIKSGGMIMVPLLISSIIVWSVAFAKWISIKNFKKELDLIKLKIPTLLVEKKVHEAKGLCQHIDSLGATMDTILQGPGANREAWNSKVFRRSSEAFQDLKKSIWIVGTIGSSAPFIGLFGTVAGIIKSFESIASSGKSGFNVVASGLAEALVATAAGILVAVMSVILYNYFQTKFSELQNSTKNLLEDVMDIL